MNSSSEGGPDLERLTRPLLAALATLAEVESTYLTVFDWDAREQEVLFVHSVGAIQVEEGLRLALPAELTPEVLPGVTRSPQTASRSQPDSWIAQRLGLRAYISVPIVVSHHHLYGMLCGASQSPRRLSEAIVTTFESFADILAQHVMRAEVLESEERARRAEEQLSTRSVFIAEAEHHLKTPLSAVQGMSMTLRDRWVDLSNDERGEFLDGIVRNSSLLAEEVDGLLNESRANIQTQEMEPVNLDVVPLVRMIARAFDGLGTDHHVVAETPLVSIAYADEGATYQVLGLLLDNAIKYSAAGGRIIVRVTSDADWITIEVQDEGIGLPANVDIFQAFVRAENVGLQPSGIGLGLHIVRSLVEAMGGTVRARRNPDRGSTFTIRLPAGVLDLT